MPDEVLKEVLIHFRLIGDEATALLQLSGNEHRRPVEQVRYILRKELVRLGYLESPKSPPFSQQEDEQDA